MIAGLAALLVGLLLALAAGVAYFVRWARRVDVRLSEHQRRQMTERDVADQLWPRNGRVTVYPVACPVEEDDDASL